MEHRYPNLIAAFRAACEALPENDALRERLDELSSPRPMLFLVEPIPEPIASALSEAV